MKKWNEDEDIDPVDEQSPSGVSRRDFLKISSVVVATPMVVGPTVAKVAGEEVKVWGPGAVPITLHVNGKEMRAQLETRVTLLEALRDHFDLTGSKKVCDRGECGACTVLMDGKTVYACSILAIDAQGHKIETIESLTVSGNLNAVQQAFVDHDAQQCGFCTPGFVVAAKALVDKYPNPTPDQITHELSGNFCRCGTYAGIRHAVVERKGA
jgi:xanthine dehydrogenase YagT iron-sulfur-binding subunit